MASNPALAVSSPDNVDIAVVSSTSSSPAQRLAPTLHADDLASATLLEEHSEEVYNTVVSFPQNLTETLPIGPFSAAT